MPNIEIDQKSGFCFGVVKAITKAEEELAKGETLYCLGDIVHNGQEVQEVCEGIIDNKKQIHKQDNQEIEKE